MLKFSSFIVFHDVPLLMAHVANGRGLFCGCNTRNRDVSSLLSTHIFIQNFNSFWIFFCLAENKCEVSAF